MAVARFAESARLGGTRPKEPKPHRATSNFGTGQEAKSPSCAIHGQGHLTQNCRTFKAFSVKQKYDALRKGKRCFKCFEAHPRDSCTQPVCSCGKNHHQMLCTAKRGEGVRDNTKPETKDEDTLRKETYLASAGSLALYPICRAGMRGSS